MGVLHIILKVGHPKIISTQISEQKILHNKRTCDSDAEDNKNDVSGGIFEV
jgi:hypothetical protein